MKLVKRILLLALCATPVFAHAQVATTSGSNLTAWNGNAGATNNNNWNQLMNSRTMASGGAGGATADFGNCNSLILRCAQPKCAGCTTIDVARPIVTGCVNSNAACKKYGDELIDFISAQMVSNANSKAQQAELAAQQAAAQQAAAQNDAQLQQMQMQMAQMQADMQAQNAQQMAQMQAALEEQKALVAAAAEQKNQQTQEAISETGTGGGQTAELSDEMRNAAENGVDPDILVRKQISGQILTKIEAAENALKTLKVTMDEAFDYAGCDSRGNNCAGPKRVKTFKEKAHAFFEPYDEIVDEAYDGLEMALAVGVDVSDVIMMLSGACNQWGKFLCTGVGEKHEVEYYTNDTCKNGRSVKRGVVKGGQECTVKMAVPPQDDSRCTLTQLIAGGGDNDPVFREWLDENYEGDRLVRVGCATSSLESIAIFGRRNSKKGTTLDLDTLERIILQDAPEILGSNRFSSAKYDAETERLKYCALTPTGYQNLLTAVQSKKLPKKICVKNEQLAQTWYYGGPIASGAIDTGLDNGKIIAAAGKQEICDRWKALAPSGCKVEWIETEMRCKLTQGECVYVGNDILSKDEYNQRENGRLAESVEDTYKGAHEDCDNAGGVFKAEGGGVCYCGNVHFRPDLYKCDKDKHLVNK